MARPYVPKAPRIKIDDRVFVVGTTGCGKTEVVMHLCRDIKRQIVVLDPKNAIHIPGAQVVYGNPALIDWRHRVIIYRPHRPSDTSETGEVNRLCRMIWERCPEKGPGLTFWVDETGDVVTAHSCSEYMHKLITQGRSHNIGMFILAQRPAHVWRAIVTNAQHIITFAQVLSPDDEKTLAGEMAIRKGHASLNDTIEWLAETFRTSDDPDVDLGPYASIHWHRKSRVRIGRPPLPQRFVGRPLVAVPDPPPGVHRLAS